MRLDVRVRDCLTSPWCNLKTTRMICLLQLMTQSIPPLHLRNLPMKSKRKTSL